MPVIQNNTAEAATFNTTYGTHLVSHLLQSTQQSCIWC